MAWLYLAWGQRVLRVSPVSGNNIDQPGIRETIIIDEHVLGHKLEVKVRLQAPLSPHPHASATPQHPVRVSEAMGQSDFSFVWIVKGQQYFLIGSLCASRRGEYRVPQAGAFE